MAANQPLNTKLQGVQSEQLDSTIILILNPSKQTKERFCWISKYCSPTPRTTVSDFGGTRCNIQCSIRVRNNISLAHQSQYPPASARYLCSNPLAQPRSEPSTCAQASPLQTHNLNAPSPPLAINATKRVTSQVSGLQGNTSHEASRPRSRLALEVPVEFPIQLQGGVESPKLFVIEVAHMDGLARVHIFLLHDKTERTGTTSA